MWRSILSWNWFLHFVKKGLDIDTPPIASDRGRIAKAMYRHGAYRNNLIFFWLDKTFNGADRDEGQVLL